MFGAWNMAPLNEALDGPTFRIICIVCVRTNGTLLIGSHLVQYTQQIPLSSCCEYVSIDTSVLMGPPHTLHGLLNSKPAGALGLSVCPLKNPVSRRSRSITAITPHVNPAPSSLLKTYFVCPTDPPNASGACHHSAYVST